VEVVDGRGGVHPFDHVIFACHADQALAMLAHPTSEEKRLLGMFGYSRNEAVLHSDPSVMPKRRRVWSSWNYASDTRGLSKRLSVTYWMNRLQKISGKTQFFVTLNPIIEPSEGLVIKRQVYEHPIFNAAAIAAQRELWSLQGVHRTWFCGAYFGAGFHEDGLQAGLAVAEALGGVRRPWSVAEESGRIHVTPLNAPQAEREVA
jgi:predicted NAD/FAD-binding protein